MSRYIDAEKFKHIINNSKMYGTMEWHDVLEMLIECPTADVVEVVRCKDCIHAKQHSYAPAECQWYCTASLQYHSDRFFCACGERRTHDN